MNDEGIVPLDVRVITRYSRSKVLIRDSARLSEIREMPTRAGSTTCGDRATQLWIKTFDPRDRLQTAFSGVSAGQKWGGFRGRSPGVDTASREAIRFRAFPPSPSVYPCKSSSCFRASRLPSPLAGISILPIGSGPLYTNTPLRTPDFFSARYSAPNSRQSGAALDGKLTGAAAFRAFLRHRSTLVPFLREASLHSAARQPAGTGSAQILRNMSPNSRWVRCPSASRSQ